MSKPRRQGMRQLVVPNNKADFQRKRLKWRRSEYTDRHEEVVSEKRERRLWKQMRKQKEEAYRSR